MNWLLTLLLCIPLVELMMRLPLAPVLADLRRTGRQSMWLMRTRSVSDDWKEKALGAYARITFLSTLKITAFLVLVLGVATLLVIGFDLFFAGFQDFVLSGTGLLATLIAATLYVMLRRAVFRG